MLLITIEYVNTWYLLFEYAKLFKNDYDDIVNYDSNFFA